MSIHANVYIFISQLTGVYQPQTNRIELEATVSAYTENVIQSGNQYNFVLSFLVTDSKSAVRNKIESAVFAGLGGNGPFSPVDYWPSAPKFEYIYVSSF